MISKEKLCLLFGYSRQAYYQHNKDIYKDVVLCEVLLQMVATERLLMPRLGTRKLIVNLEREYQINIGRDALFDLLRDHGLLICRSKSKVPKTTDSWHSFMKYKHLVRLYIPKAPHKLWVSDMTYIRTLSNGFSYLFLITDAYSRKIIGYDLSTNMEAANGIKALEMAINQLPEEMRKLINNPKVTDSGLIHHSDRGSQYCCKEYVTILDKTKIAISMTENGDPKENALAERVNGILKTEWLYYQPLYEHAELKLKVEEIIFIYNTCRPHSSIDMNTPEQAHLTEGLFTKLWSYYYERPIRAKERDEDVIN